MIFRLQSHCQGVRGAVTQFFIWREILDLSQVTLLSNRSAIARLIRVSAASWLSTIGLNQAASNDDFCGTVARLGIDGAWPAMAEGDSRQGSSQKI